jgi:Domain of unknown function (DUF4365)
MTHRPKKLLPAPLLGEQGAAIAKLLVLEMGSTWHETNTLLERGVDGWVELRDPKTGIMRNEWIAVQCKAHQGLFDQEDERSFGFKCQLRDISYWTRGNMPVILIVVRPEERAAWWKPITTEHLVTGAAVELRFDKAGDRLTPDSFPSLCELAASNAHSLSAQDAQLSGGPRGDGGEFIFSFSTVIGGRPAPAIPVLLKGPGGSLPTFGLVDSGADVSCIPFTYATGLGVDLSACERIETETTAGPTGVHLWEGDITARLLDTEIPLEGLFAPTPVPLLGRSDFFSHFDVTIDQRRRTVTLRR